nr:hypothetical protein [Tanacetum cinerariifolium]
VKEREQYFKIQDLKAQLQDRNIAISELKKLIEKGKGKYVDTKFDKPSVVRQLNAQRIPKPSVLGVNHNTNVSRPQHKSNQTRDKVLPNNSQVKVKKTQVEVRPVIPSVSNKMKSVTARKGSLNSKTLNANPRCDSQVDVHNDLSKPVTTHYLPKEREASSAKPHHMIASSNSKISSKNMTRFSSNDMVHNHYLEEAKKKTQERSRNFEPSLIPSARSQSIANGSKPMPRRNTQTSRNWTASKNIFITTKTVPIAKHPRNSKNDFV